MLQSKNNFGNGRNVGVKNKEHICLIEKEIAVILPHLTVKVS